MTLVGRKCGAAPGGGNNVGINTVAGENNDLRTDLRHHAPAAAGGHATQHAPGVTQRRGCVWFGSRRTPAGWCNKSVLNQPFFYHFMNLFITYAKVMLILMTAHNDVILHFMVCHSILMKSLVNPVCAAIKTRVSLLLFSSLGNRDPHSVFICHVNLCLLTQSYQVMQITGLCYDNKLWDT